MWQVKSENVLEESGEFSLQRCHFRATGIAAELLISPTDETQLNIFIYHPDYFNSNLKKYWGNNNYDEIQQVELFI